MSRGRRSQVVLHEGDEPDSIAHLLDAYVLAGEDQTQVDLAFAEANAAAMGDSDRAVVKWVLELVQTSIGAVGRSLELCRILHAQRLVRPLPVVALDEVIEPGLLLEEVVRHRLGRFFLPGSGTYAHDGRSVRDGRA